MWISILTASLQRSPTGAHLRGTRDENFSLNFSLCWRVIIIGCSLAIAVAQAIGVEIT
ncbi:hypothetical protein [Brasilonema sp. UFV-L1]|uniref:hypothetical protein n=1 Tax=Brasilonema sp. UFV-L1 TaxID=2234130 RepID=UPI00145F801A|nr:hypothetical protein [Brasilonema sp. UFV-L1]